MTIPEIAELITAMATAMTVGFLAWERWERRKAIEPAVEITALRISGPTKRSFALSVVIRNRADVGLRFGTLGIVRPSDAVLIYEDRRAEGFQFQFDIEPGQSLPIDIGLDLGVTMHEWERIVFQARYRCALKSLGREIKRKAPPITL